jgi:RND family efflux transporter MFP subunit
MKIKESTGSSSSSSRYRLPLIITGIAIAAGAAGFYGMQPASASEASNEVPVPPAPKVTIAPVMQQNLIDYRELLGRVEAQETVEVRPRVSGHIDEVRLVAGQTVKKGDVLFIIDPRWYRAAFDLAVADAEGAKVRVSIAESQARRAENLSNSQAISAEEAEIRTSRLAEAKSELLAAEAKLENARLDLEHTEVKAPISGRISRAFVTSGNLVSGTPGSGTLLTSIVSDGDVYVYADVDEETWLTFDRLRHEGKILSKDGRIPVEMQLSDENNFPHQGTVESADNHLDSSTGSLVLRMVFPNPNGKLVPGLSARVRLPVSPEEPTLFVSERAIGTSQSQKFVFTVDASNTVAFRSVKIGPVINGKRVIREGLQTGDRVIVNGLQHVTAGITVDPELAVAAK